jgi:hypothetical protein
MSRPSAEHLWERLGDGRGASSRRDVALAGASRWGTCSGCGGKTFDGTGYDGALLRACTSCGHVEPVKAVPR